jgi:hypothetical protein
MPLRHECIDAFTLNATGWRKWARPVRRHREPAADPHYPHTFFSPNWLKAALIYRDHDLKVGEVELVR